MYSIDDAKEDAARELDRLQSNFVYSIHSSSPDLNMNEATMDILRACRTAAFVEEIIDDKIRSITAGRDVKHGEPVLEEARLTFESLVDFLDSLPLTVPSTEEQEQASSKDGSLKQLQRDIERDCLFINGVQIIGSIGLDEVIAEMGRTIDTAFATCHLPPLPEEVRNEFSLSSLRKAARTNSGGQSFQALQSIIPSSHQLVPLSSLASPLRILISLGSQKGRANKVSTTHSLIGLIAIIQTTTVFSIESIEHHGSENHSVKEGTSISVLYENEVFIAFEGSNQKGLGKPSDLIIGNGKLTFERRKKS